ncbi:MAG: DNA repair protein RecO [Pseudomonadota bacterium]
MEWTDSGILLSTRRHGESQEIVTFLTEHRGRYAGILRRSRKINAALQPGTQARLVWKARLSEHLGAWTIEETQSRWISSFHKPAALTVLLAACTWLDFVTPEREPAPRLYDALHKLIVELDQPDLGGKYVNFELCLLREIGFGLQLSHCAVTGEQENLGYVSPRTGRAVTKEVGKAYHDRLLELPAFLTTKDQVADAQQISLGLKLTGYFLQRYALGPYQRSMPPARARLDHLSFAEYMC